MKTDVFYPVQIEEKNEAEVSFVCCPGIWIDGQMFWLNEQGERLLYEYELTFRAKYSVKNNRLNMIDMYVLNHSNRMYDIKMIMMHQLKPSSKEHFAFISPQDNLIFHHYEDQLYLMNGAINGSGIAQCTIQPLWNIHSNRYWKEIQTGNLQYSPMSKGLATSIFTLETKIKEKETVRANTWIISGHDKELLLAKNQTLLKSIEKNR